MIKTFKTWGGFVDAVCAHVADSAPAAGTPLPDRILAAQAAFVSLSRKMGHTLEETQALRLALCDWYRRNPQPRAALTLICDYLPTAYSVRGVWTPPEKATS